MHGPGLQVVNDLGHDEAGRGLEAISRANPKELRMTHVVLSSAQNAGLRLRGVLRMRVDLDGPNAGGGSEASREWKNPWG